MRFQPVAPPAANEATSQMTVTKPNAYTTSLHPPLIAAAITLLPDPFQNKTPYFSKIANESRLP